MNPLCTSGQVLAGVEGRMGLITLNRAKALNALSLPMVQDLMRVLHSWQADPTVMGVAIRGMGKGPHGGEQPFGTFCAGGDIRFFHQAALAGDYRQLANFFNEEYTLNHLIHTYPKPFIALMDGVCMGGGMGISQGASLRVVTERSSIAMPETAIGLFPDVGGGYFLSRCPGRVGEYLALTGQSLGPSDAIAIGLADGAIPSGQLDSIWAGLAQTPFENANAIERFVAIKFIAHHAALTMQRSQIDAVFALEGVPAMRQALAASASDWAHATLAQLERNSPLMLAVTLEQIRRARSMSLADDLRMERTMVYHCFHLRPGEAGETVEGIRALAIDKDRKARWNPARSEEVTPTQVQSFFDSPWAVADHPLRNLA